MNYPIINVRERKDLAQRAIDYFADKWGIERRIYDDCIMHSLTTSSRIPHWYLMMDDDAIIGSYGLIMNDFISRQDLYPWLCALYVEESYRGQQLGSVMLAHARREAGRLGFPYLHLATNHVHYYEKYGWEYIGDAYHPWNVQTRMYRHSAIYEPGRHPQISDARAEDLEDILSLQYRAFKQESRLYNDAVLPPMKQTLDELSDEAQNTVILKYTLDGRIVGSVRAKEKDGTCYIGRLVVDPDFQNRGIGKTLMAAIEHRFQGARYEIFTGEQSEKTIAIYESLGYCRFKSEKEGPGPCHVFLEKNATTKPS